MDVAEISRRLLRLHRDAERITGLTIVVHDRTGSFIDLIKEFKGHRHWFCLAGKREHPDYDHRCQAHCRFAMNARAAAADAEPFVHDCWKGGSEAVAPIHRRGVHMLTLFGGPLRSGPHPPSGVIPEINRVWRQLPPADPDRLLAVSSVLVAVGHAMLELLNARAEGSGRKAAIERLIERRMHEHLGSEDLGRHLGLSPSRAVHVVAELYGKAFGDLLRDRRLARAQQLLVAGDDPVGVIAKRCGFLNHQWFNRLFARTFGMPPARWRRRQRAGA